MLAGIPVALPAVGADLLAAERLSGLVAPSVVQLHTRLLGLLLSAIAVQLVVDGVRGLVRIGRDLASGSPAAAGSGDGGEQRLGQLGAAHDDVREEGVGAVVGER